MANARVSDMAALVAPADGDLLYAIDLDAGAPRDRKLAISALRTLVVSPQTTRARASHALIEGVSVSATPIVLAPGIETTFGGAATCALTFAALITAVVRSAAVTAQVAGYELKGVVRRQTNAPVAALVATPLRTTFGEDLNWTVEAIIDGSNLLAFRFTGTAATTVDVVGSVSLVYAQGVP